MTRTSRAKVALALSLPAAMLVALPGLAQTSPAGSRGDVEWRHYAADRASSKYSAADQITIENVSKLEVAWSWDTPDAAIESQARAGDFKGTPLMVDGVLYVVTPYNLVAALDPTTGKQLWTFDPRAYEIASPAHGGFTHRGLELWQHETVTRLILATGAQQLVSIDPVTGEPDAGFGQNGFVDMRADVAEEARQRQTGLSSPPIVCGDTIVVGMIVSDFGTTQKMPAGHVRGYDVRTGERRWIFHTIPQEGEPGAETWEDESWRYSGNTNVWSMMSCDEELGYVYLPIGTPTSDIYGGHRLGDNLYAESLVALDARSGKKMWHFQAVHHGLWDYDFPCAPNLVDVEIDGQTVPMVAQVSKQGFTYVFHRETGEPIWPIEERATAPSTVPGERAAKTQPFPTRPPPFDLQGIGRNDLIDFTPELRAQAEKALEDFVLGPLFTPPVLVEDGGKKGTVMVPGMVGGANWGGAAVDPDSGVLFVPSQTRPSVAAVQPPAGRVQTDLRFMRTSSPIQGPGGLPVVKPPWSRITAIDLRSGEILWQVPHGDGPRDHPLLADLDLPRLGTYPISGLPPGWVMATRTLLFTAQAVPRDPAEPRGPAAGWVRAYDKSNGELLWEEKIEQDPRGAPMTYVHRGRQYLVVPTGGADATPRRLLAWALPNLSESSTR